MNNILKFILVVSLIYLILSFTVSELKNNYLQIISGIVFFFLSLQSIMDKIRNYDKNNNQVHITNESFASVVQKAQLKELNEDPGVKHMQKIKQQYYNSTKK